MRKNNHRSTLAMAFAFIATLGVSACGLFEKFTPTTPQTSPIPKEVKALNQGAEWTLGWRAAFYKQDQGSRIMPVAWFRALRNSDGAPFAADGLVRYGYLGNLDSPDGLPVGFTTGPWPYTAPNTNYVGMTCAACHTRQIRAEGESWRVDGGPALTDLQSLFWDLDVAVRRTLASDREFAQFTADVLRKVPTRADIDNLRAEVTAWSGPYHTLIDAALPKSNPWGVGRADAVGMILNRLGGLDIGTGPDHVIAANIRVADAPVRYPFLWNAPRQDKTQWPGFAPNGNPLYALVRNLGEVYGVFGVFHPQPRPKWVSGIDYISVNSGNFKGLDAVEQMARRIGDPKWPWAVDQTLAGEGRELYMGADAQGRGCVNCHGIREDKHLLLPATWRTPLKDVGTDIHEYDTLRWTGDSGVMYGSKLPFVPAIKREDSLVDILAVATAGAIMQKAGLRDDPASPSLSRLLNDPKKKNQEALAKAVHTPVTTANSKCDNGSAPYCYEARVLHGIWAAAPFLHNGSVPTLADLLKPSDQRRPSFDVGADYDITNLGLAEKQAGPMRSTTVTTGCEARGSGNSRCGHEGPGFGTDWTDHQKRAVLEFLKTL